MGALLRRCKDPARFKHWGVVGVVLTLAAVGAIVGFMVVKKIGPFAPKSEAADGKSTSYGFLFLHT